MKQSLQLKLGQHLTMTPQLQQAIRLLQLSALELSTEIQDALDSNMMLEVADGEDGSSDETPPESPSASSDEAATDAEIEAPFEVGGGDPSEEDAPQPSTDIPEDLPVDTEWDEIYDTMVSSGNTAVQREDDGSAYERGNGDEESLFDHMHWQINLVPMSDTDRAIAFAIIDALDGDGYLTVDVPDLCAALGGNDNDAPEEDEVTAVLHLIQGLDPIGVAARDLRECLLLQLKQLDEQTPWLPEARQCVEDYMDLLGVRDYNQLVRKLKMSKDELAQVIALIQTLNPRPGAQYSTDQAEYVVPDVFVHKHRDRWRVELNPDVMPALRINPYYASLIKRGDSSDENTSMRAHMQEARWFIKSLQSRSETLLKVATAIVERQRAFLEHGDEAMRPLVLHDIAEVLEMHESTISRVTTRKYMHTPRGIFELKYFFSSHVSTTLGGEASSTAIRAVIKKLIAAENIKKPLSDNKIATLLSEQGVQVARRTVAKYREAMSIPPSNERKRLA